MNEVIYKEASAQATVTMFIEIGSITFKVEGDTTMEKHWDDSFSLTVEVNRVSLLADSSYWLLMPVMPDHPAMLTKEYDKYEENEVDKLILDQAEQIVFGRYAPWLS